jgi:VWFA-related protein
LRCATASYSKGLDPERSSRGSIEEGCCAMRINLSLVAVAALQVSGMLMAQKVVPVIPPTPKRIYLGIEVADRSGVPVSGLTQQDFTLLDNEVPRPLTTFAAVAGIKAPVEILYIIDAVNTPYSTVSYQRDQIEKSLRANGGQLAHPATFVILTDRGTTIYKGVSTDGNKLGDALEHADIGLRDINRSSGFYGGEDRAALSLKALQQIGAYEEGRPGRKLVLWVSPGWPLLSGPEVELTGKDQQQIYREVASMSTLLRRARITLYNINTWGPGESMGRELYYEDFLKGVSKPEQTNMADIGLQVLATQSGGLVLNSNDVGTMIQKCLADADDYYQISFDPSSDERADTYHSIVVRVARPNVTTRTRASYYSAQ